MKKVFLHKQENHMENTASFLVSMLVHYPEVGGISYDSKKDAIQLRFILFSDEVKQEPTLTRALHTWLKLRKTDATLLQVTTKKGKDYCLLYVDRDAKSFSWRELQFLVELLHQAFPNKLRAPQAIPDEGLYFQEMLDYSWQQNKHGKARGQIIAYREKGQVMVFNC